MSIKTFTPPVDPSPGTRRSQDVTLLEAEFGDGYSQHMPRGKNHIRRKLSLVWEALTKSQVDQIDQFFWSQEGYKAFYYTPPGERKALLWTCKEWNHGTNSGVWTANAELVQSFNLG